MHCQFTFPLFFSLPGNGPEENPLVKNSFLVGEFFSPPFFLSSLDSHRFKTDVLTGGGQLGLYLPWWGNTNTERKRGCVFSPGYLMSRESESRGGGALFFSF